MKEDLGLSFCSLGIHYPKDSEHLNIKRFRPRIASDCALSSCPSQCPGVSKRMLSWPELSILIVPHDFYCIDNTIFEGLNQKLWICLWSPTVPNQKVWIANPSCPVQSWMPPNLSSANLADHLQVCLTCALFTGHEIDQSVQVRLLQRMSRFAVNTGLHHLCHEHFEALGHIRFASLTAPPVLTDLAASIPGSLWKCFREYVWIWW